MQISSSLLFDRSASRMSSLMSTATKLQTQIATGKKYTSPSENVEVMQQIAEFDRKDADAKVYDTNLTLSASMLKQADSTMQSITTQLQRATDLVNQASTGTYNTADRKVMGDELKSIVSTLVSLGNTRDQNGQPLFGDPSGQPAVIDSKNGTFTYNNAAKMSEIPIGDNLSVQATETAERIFKPGGKDTLAMLSTLADSLIAGDDTGASAKAAMEPLKTASEQVSVVQASVGARAARVELQQNVLTNANLDRAELRTSIEDTDLTQAIGDFMKTLTVLQATQSSFSKLSQLSLFTYLR